MVAGIQFFKSVGGTVLNVDFRYSLAGRDIPSCSSIQYMVVGLSNALSYRICAPVVELRRLFLGDDIRTSWRVFMPKAC